MEKPTESMNTNEELKTRPDFDEIAKDYVRSKNFPFAHPGAEYLREGINYGYKDCWTTHVEPLQAEVEYQKGKKLTILQVAKANRNWHKKRYVDLQSENQKLREALSGWKKDMKYAIKNAIQMQEQEKSEEYNQGCEESIKYAVEILDKHIELLKDKD